MLIVYIYIPPEVYTEVYIYIYLRSILFYFNTIPLPIPVLCKIKMLYHVSPMLTLGYAARAGSVLVGSALLVGALIAFVGGASGDPGETPFVGRRFGTKT